MKRKLNENDVPEPVGAGFADFGLDARLLQSIARERFDKPTPVQSRTIPLVQQGKNVAIRSKTGSGKTVAYILPIINSILQDQSTSPATVALVLVPTKELASQIWTVVRKLSKHCGKAVTSVNVSRQEKEDVMLVQLRETPTIIIATPNRFNHFLESGAVSVAALRYLVIDEADLVVTYGHEDDLRSIAAAIPDNVQALLVSATLRSDAAVLTQLFTKLGSLELVDLTEQESAETNRLQQYIVPTAEDEKFLLIYAIFKLQLIKGKIIIFVADVDRCYRLKLFLEQFGVRSCILNSELPVNSRLHVVEEFNKGVYDTLVASDDNEVMGERDTKKTSVLAKQLDEEAEEEAGSEESRKEADSEMNVDDKEEPEAQKANGKKTRAKKSTHKGQPNQDREYGVSRGIDFRRVTCVLNFDLPQSSKAYTHRVGRTARAGQNGMALSFFVPKELFRKHKPTSISQCANDEKVLARIQIKQEESGNQLDQWQFDMQKLDGFRYRLADALRAVTRIAVREARTRELRQELLNSAKLQRHFEEHPEDLRHLRHDTESHSVRHQAHLKHVPDYLLPTGGKAALKKDVGFVGMKGTNENRVRKARALNKARGKGRLARGKGHDPLKTLNLRGRGKK